MAEPKVTPIKATESGERAVESEGLEPLVGKGIIMGYYPEINGPGAELVNFTPTRAELMTLAYDYLDRYFSVQETYAMGCSGSFECREESFSWRRFNSIAEMLSPGKPIEEFEQYIEQGWSNVEKVRRDAGECSGDEAANKT